MTKLHNESETCSVCEHPSDHISIMSTNQMGYPDLDSRPPRMMRSTMAYWVRRCPSCGYCAPHLSESESQTRQIIQPEPYQQQLKHSAYPELANSFLCHSMIAEQMGDYPTAGWHAIYAAWACDDSRAKESAISCRQRALLIFQMVRAKRNTFAQEVGLEEVIMADLLRRTEQFDQVDIVCQEGLKQNPREIIREMLDAQLFFAHRQDTGSYSLEIARKIIGTAAPLRNKGAG